MEIEKTAKRLYRVTKRNALVRTIPFNLTLKQVIRRLELSGGICQKSGLPFCETSKYTKNPYAPSIDRIDSREGYHPNNVRIVCVCVNIAMNIWGDEVFDNMVNYAQVFDRKEPVIIQEKIIVKEEITFKENWSIPKIYRGNQLRKELPRVGSIELTKMSLALIEEARNECFLCDINDNLYLTEMGLNELKKRLH